MMPMVRPAARAGVPRPERTKGAAAAPPRKLPSKVLREREGLVIGNTPSVPRAWPRGDVNERNLKRDVGEGRLRRNRSDHRFPLAFGLASRATLAELGPSRPSA